MTVAGCALFIPPTAPSYQCLSTDLSGSKVANAAYRGANLYFTDTGDWYKVLDDLTLAPLYYNVKLSGSNISVSGSYLVTASSIDIGNFPTTYSGSITNIISASLVAGGSSVFVENFTTDGSVVFVENFVTDGSLVEITNLPSEYIVSGSVTITGSVITGSSVFVENFVTDGSLVEITNLPSDYLISGSVSISGSVITGSIVDVNNIFVDNTNNIPVTIGYSHYKIHNGESFFYSDSVTLGNGGIQYYLMETPDTSEWAHIVSNFAHTLTCKTEVFEGGDRSGSTIQIIGNKNRNNSGSSVMNIYKGISGGTTDGSLIFVYEAGASTGKYAFGGAYGTRDEIILKQNCKYLYKFTSSADSNVISLVLDWYEHTNL
jgi:predicted RecA/RadA family phage recombinase